MITEGTESKLFCYRHPDRETLLRCNRCEKPICSSCATLTPTGYRCVECVRSQQKVFDTAKWIDYPISMLIAFVFAFIGSYFASFLGFFTLFIGPIFGILIAEVVRRVLNKRRSKNLFMWVTAAAIFGSLPYVILYLFDIALSFGGGGSGLFFSGMFPLLWRGVYTFLVASTLYYRLSGIRV